MISVIRPLLSLVFFAIDGSTKMVQSFNFRRPFYIDHFSTLDAISLKVDHFKPKNLRFFLRENVFNLRFLSNFNENYGMLIFTFILLNALYLMVLFFTQLSSSSRIFIISIILMQIFFLLLISYFDALIALKIHKPAKVFLSLSIRTKKKPHWSLANQLRLLQYLEQFHTKNLYTVTYGRAFGKITLQSFIKLLFYYGKLLMFTFKLVNQ